MSDYEMISPFKWQLLESFPFIAEDFDQLTEYALYCKLVEYMNKVIDGTNTLGEDVEEYIAKFNQLQNYVENFFDNLDVQDEIDNKLNEMASDGTLAQIIEDYATIPELTSRVENLEDITGGNTIFIGDSYGVGTTNTNETIDSWIVYLKQKLGLDSTNSYSYAEGGAGFVATGVSGHTFKTLLSDNITDITDTDKITRIIVCGGFNDRNQNVETAISNFMTYVKSNFANATTYIGMIGATKEVSSNANTYRYNLYNICLAGYKRCTKYGAIYLSGVENALKDYSYMSADYQHPNADGYKSIASFIYNALYSGKNDFYSMQEASTLTLPNNATGGTMNTNLQRMGEFTSIQIAGNITFTSQTLNGHSLEIGTLSSNYYRYTNHFNCLIPCVFQLVGASTLNKTGFIRIGGQSQLTLYFDDTNLSSFTELKITQCGLTIPTNVS